MPIRNTGMSAGVEYDGVVTADIVRPVFSRRWDI